MNTFKYHYSQIRTFPKEFWVVLASSFMNQVGNMAIVFLVLYLNQKLQFTLTKASLALVTFSGGMLVSGMVSGIPVNKFGAAPVMTVSLLITGIAFLFLPTLHTYATLLPLCLLLGVAYGTYRPASQTLISQLSLPGMYKLTFSCYRLVINLGMSIGPAFGSFLAGYSFKSVFIVNGMTNLLACVILFTGLIKSPWFKRRAHSSGIKRFSYDPVMRLFLLGMIPVSMIYFQHDSTLAVFLNRDMHFPLSFYGLLFTLNTLLIVIFELPLNILTIAWPYRLNLTLGSLLITSGFTGLYFVRSEWHVVLLAIVWTFGEMILYPAAASYVAEIASEQQRGSYMAMYSTCSNLGMLLGPWGGAIIMENIGSSSLWLICGAWGLLSIFLLSSIGKHKLYEGEQEPLTSFERASVEP